MLLEIILGMMKGHQIMNVAASCFPELREGGYNRTLPLQIFKGGLVIARIFFSVNKLVAYFA